MSTSLRGIAAGAKSHKNHHFGNLHGLLNEESLRWCFYLLRKNATSGVDGVTSAEYERDLEKIFRISSGDLGESGIMRSW